MSRWINISLVNFPFLPPNEPDRLGKTLKRMEECIEQAASCKSDLIAFPEMCNYLGAADPWQFEPLDGPTITVISRKAKKYRIHVVCPLATLEHGQRYNSSVLISPNGQIVGVYHKNFPTHRELNIGIIPGRETPVFETKLGRIGLCICFDINYWEVGAGLSAKKAELVIWSSEWEGGRILIRWPTEFGFYLGAACANRSTIVDIAGRKLISLGRQIYEVTEGLAPPLVTATIDMDRRLLHPDYNIKRLKRVYRKYGGKAIYTEWLSHECLLIFESNLPDVSTNQMISEFDLETMSDYLARGRLDRKLALKAKYPQRRIGVKAKKSERE